MNKVSQTSVRACVHPFTRDVFYTCHAVLLPQRSSNVSTLLDCRHLMGNNFIFKKMLSL